MTLPPSFNLFHAVILALALAAPKAIAAAPDTLRFASRDGATELVGYLWRPTGPGPFAAVVMLHGRAGPYSSLARGVYDASTLSQRHLHWGEYWAAQGYVSLHVDSFGPRGYPQGFSINSYRNRPAAVSEQTARPLDAYGALDYLRSRSDVMADRIGVFGWSNGAMAVLAALSRPPAGVEGFRAAVALYPGCRAQDDIDYRPYAPLLMLLAGADREVSPIVCERVAARLRDRAPGVEQIIYAGAEHGFDDPARSARSVAANRVASDDTHRRAARFFAHYLQAGGQTP